MLKHLYILLAITITTTSTFAQEYNERLEYDLKFGFIKGGKAVFTSHDTIIKNNNFIGNSLNGQTTGIINKLYEVNDVFESVLLPDKLTPIKASKNLKEKSYRFQNEVIFDQDSLKAKSKNSGTHLTADNICDVSALFSYIRFSGIVENIEIDEIIEIPFWDTDEWYYLRLKYTGIENIKTCLGKFNCIRLEPQEVTGRFFNKKNPVNLWITNNDEKLPVLMELNFSIGSVKCELVNYKNSEKSIE